jgi:hypothetical protein
LQSIDRKHLRAPDRRSTSSLRFGSKEVNLKWKFNPFNISTFSKLIPIKTQRKVIAVKHDSLSGELKHQESKNSGLKIRIQKYHRKTHSDNSDVATRSINLIKEYDADHDALLVSDLSRYVGESLRLN